MRPSRKLLAPVVRTEARPSPMAALEQYAWAHCLPSAREARGLCLHASVDLAAQAHRLGLSRQVSLLRWRLKVDPDFNEHWALKVAEDVVLDLTAAQIDGKPMPRRRIASYPSHFGRPSEYPIELVLPHAMSGPLDGRVARRVIWRLHRALAWYECSAAWRGGSVLGVAAAGLGLGVESMRLGLGYLLEKAIARRSLLLRDLE